jgi:tRNA C32,U32 (ribose-2'-O)-methylase TrmJ
MGKPSFKSRKSTRRRKKTRKVRLIKMIENKEEEISDLQIQMQEFKKSVFDTGKNILDEVKKTSRENNNLVEWLKKYDKQIKENEKEIYDLNVRLYFSQQQQQH